jgi:hypothetical protein
MTASHTNTVRCRPAGLLYAFKYEMLPVCVRGRVKRCNTISMYAS